MPSSNEATKFEPIDLSSFSRVDGEDVRQVEDLKRADSEEYLSKYEMQDIKNFSILDVKPDDKSSAFHLNPVVKQHLNLDVEEKLAVEEEVRLKVEAKIKEVQVLAKKEAYEKGYKEGLENAKKDIFESEAPQREKFKNLLEDLSSVRSEVVEANKKFFIDIVYRVVRYILLRELHNDDEYIVRLATHLVERQECKDDVRIFLSPSDYHRAIEIDDSILKNIGKIKNLTVDIDEMLQVGNCRLETKNGIVESDISKQIHEIANSMGLDDREIVPVDLSFNEKTSDDQVSETPSVEIVEKNSEENVIEPKDKSKKSQDASSDEMKAESKINSESNKDDSQKVNEADTEKKSSEEGSDDTE